MPTRLSSVTFVFLASTALLVLTLLPGLVPQKVAASAVHAPAQEAIAASTAEAAELLAAAEIVNERGDCNDDAVIDAGDIAADVLEVFDGDGSWPLDAADGTFAGSPVGCNANGDATIDAGDISCIILTIFGGAEACPVDLTLRAHARLETGEPVADAVVALDVAHVGGTESFTSTTGTTDARGTFTFSFGTHALPLHVVADVTSTRRGPPTLHNARRVLSQMSPTDITVTLPNPLLSELVIEGNAAEDFEGTIRVDGLPPQVDRVFARRFDPESNADLFPGDLMERRVIPLDSTVFMWLEAVDAAGDPINDFTSLPGGPFTPTIRALVPTEQYGDFEDPSPGNGTAEAPIYFYDETTDEWRQERLGC